MSYIQIIDEYKRYKIGENTVVANNGINFSIEKGEFVIILWTKWCWKNNRTEYSWRNGYL